MKTKAKKLTLTEAGELIDLRREVTKLREENVRLQRDLAGLQLGEPVDFDITIPEKVHYAIVNTDEYVDHVRSLIVGAYLDGKFK